MIIKKAKNCFNYIVIKNENSQIIIKEDDKGILHILYKNVEIEETVEEDVELLNNPLGIWL
jgi:hypothetical protein